MLLGAISCSIQPRVGLSLNMSTSSGDDRDVWEKIDDINLIIYEEQIEGLVDVRHGRLNDKDICVKSVKEGVLGPKEVEHLILCQSVPNVIQFSFKATHEGYEHLVFEPYQYTLETFLVEHKDLLLHDGFPTALLFKLIRDMIKGLFDIHRLRVIHGNITPWNIMVVESHEDNNDRKYIAKICDFAMSRRLEQRNGNLHQRRRINLPNDTRDYFWPAPEQRDRNMPQGQKLDVFSLGCVIAYCIIGEHPFGEEDQYRLYNIKNNDDDDELPLIDELPNHPELINLIKSMVKRKERVSINEVMSHPLFWDLTRQIQFLELASDFIQGHPNSRNSLDNKTEEILGDNRDWRVRAGNEAIWSGVDRGRLAYGNTVSQLLRLIRNLSSHRGSWGPQLLAMYRTTDSLLNYFLMYYPRLVIDVYCALKGDSYLRDMPDFRSYYFTPFD